MLHLYSVYRHALRQSFPLCLFFFFFFNDTATTEIYTLSLHDALPIYKRKGWVAASGDLASWTSQVHRSEEHTSELQSLRHLVCRLLLEKKLEVYDRWPSTEAGEGGAVGRQCWAAN